jgi:queuine tRNA-ribosyltransferase
MLQSLPASMAKQNSIITPHGEIVTPAFLPDATYGAVKTLSMTDLAEIGISEFVTTTLHLEQHLGSEYIRTYGGLHKFLGWERPILTDSGGFQVFSLIYRRQNKNHRISDAGCSFLDPRTGKYSLLTPETSQQIQHNLGADLRVVLDEPVQHTDSLASAKEALRRTTLWAKRSKQKFLELNQLSENDFNDPKVSRPLLVGVIQGGNNLELRRESALRLQEIGFDIYGFGGLPLHKETTWRAGGPSGFNHELLAYVTELVPDKPKYGLGIGTPDDIEYCTRLGWQLFDTVLPTRNARHGTLYVSKGQGDKEFVGYDVLHMRSERYKLDHGPVDSNCDCECCRTISRAYLRYLLRINEAAGQRLATIHNLRFYSRLMAKLQAELNA